MKKLLFIIQLICISVLLNACRKESVDMTDTASIAQNEEDYLFREGCYAHGSDDYLHPEYFTECDSIVIWDHFISSKFRDVIIPYVADSTGVLIDMHNIDLYITNPVTGEEKKFGNIFRWRKDKARSPFVLNTELHDLWGYSGETITFSCRCIHRATGIDIAQIWEHHSTITVKFQGL